MRIFGGIVLGLLLGFLSIWAIEMVGHRFYPLPAELNPRNLDQVEALIATMPLGARLFVVGAWFGGALIGSAAAMAVARRAWAAWTIAGVVAFAAILNVVVIPHPTLMQIGAVAAPLIGGLLGRHLGGHIAARRPEPAAPAEASDAQI